MFEELDDIEKQGQQDLLKSKRCRLNAHAVLDLVWALTIRTGLHRSSVHLGPNALGHGFPPDRRRAQGDRVGWIKVRPHARSDQAIL